MTYYRPNAKRVNNIKLSFVLGALFLFVPVQSMGESDKKLYEMGTLEMYMQGDPCAEWLHGARATYEGVVGEKGITTDQRRESVKRRFPEGSFGYIIKTLAIDLSANGKSKQEVGRAVVEKCREYKTKYIKGKVKDPNPEKKDN